MSFDLQARNNQRTFYHGRRTEKILRKVFLHFLFLQNTHINSKLSFAIVDARTILLYPHLINICSD